MPKCHDCGKFCRPVEWQMIYSCALPEPQEEIYKCASCVEKNGSFVPQSGIKPEHSCGGRNRDYYDNEESCRANYPEFFDGKDNQTGQWNSTPK